MNYTAVFQGGGLKSIAYIGAILALEEEGYICTKAAGVSAGAIFAALLTAGYTGIELLDILNNINIDNLLKKEKQSIKQTLNNKGLYSLYYIEKFIENLLIKKNKYSFSSFNKKLKILATNTTKKIPIVLPDNLMYYNINSDYYPVSKAVAMSCAFPFFFKPIKLNNDNIADGGIINNFPYNLIEYNKDKLVIGFLLTKQNIKDIPENINIIKLDTRKIKILNFKIKKEEQLDIIKKSYIDTKRQLKELNLI